MATNRRFRPLQIQFVYGTIFCKPRLVKLAAKSTNPEVLYVSILEKPNGFVLVAFDFYLTGRLLPDKTCERLRRAWNQECAEYQEMRRRGVHG